MHLAVTSCYDFTQSSRSHNVQNAKKGDFARHRLKGKRAIELGSGMGLGGFAFALLGCDTTVTDTAEVVGLLQRNYENNLSSAALRGGFAASADIFNFQTCLLLCTLALNGICDTLQLG